eukprot:CAMPEP_0119123454 /NCGR_PEP_ID=MMETSP1310-20130426/3397_1 /TAXON_ID=464262 /ORGANISM="Genus nov. species nov., Strain RCC2339" /LENGTH=230 /DNA_ID=CAMNT_0007113275 /DNA_START=202 /DNA_END=894 /DNA_ORIENTATION=+
MVAQRLRFSETAVVRVRPDVVSALWGSGRQEARGRSHVVGRRDLHFQTVLYAEGGQKGGGMQKREKGKEETAVSTAVKKAVETGKQVGYTGVVLVTIAAAAMVLYSVFKKFLSSENIDSLVWRVSSIAKKDPDVQRLIGDQIKVHGEGARRRTYYKNERFYDEDEVENLVLRFYLEGNYGRGVGVAHYKRREGKLELANAWVDCNKTKRVPLVRDFEMLYSVEDDQNQGK